MCGGEFTALSGEERGGAEPREGARAIHRETRVGQAASFPYRFIQGAAAGAVCWGEERGVKMSLFRCPAWK